MPYERNPSIQPASEVQFACRTFNDFVYCLDVIIEANHKPITAIVSKPLHSAPVRLQRMLLKLKSYTSNFVYKKGTELFVADTLSRAYTTEEIEEDD